MARLKGTKDEVQQVYKPKSKSDVAEMAMLWCKQKMFLIYEHFKDPIERANIEGKNFSYQPISQKFSLRAEEIDMFLDGVCLISQEKKTREVCEFIAKLRTQHNKSSKVKKMTFSKDVKNFRLFDPVSPIASLDDGCFEEETKASLEVPAKEDTFQEVSLQSMEAIYEEEHEAYLPKQIVQALNDVDNAKDDIFEYFANNPSLDELREVDSVLLHDMHNFINEVMNNEQANIHENDDLRKLGIDVVGVGATTTRYQSTNKWFSLKKILLVSLGIISIGMFSVLVIHFGLFDKLFGNKDVAPKEIVREDPAIPTTSIPTLNKKIGLTPTETFREKSDEPQLPLAKQNINQKPIMVPVVEEQNATSDMNVSKQATVKNSFEEATQRFKEVAKEEEAIVVEALKTSLPAQPLQIPVKSLDEIEKLTRDGLLKIKDNGVEYQGTLFKEGEQLNEKFKLIRIVDLRTIKVLDIVLNEPRRVQK